MPEIYPYLLTRPTYHFLEYPRRAVVQKLANNRNSSAYLASKDLLLFPEDLDCAQKLKAEEASKILQGRTLQQRWRRLRASRICAESSADFRNLIFEFPQIEYHRQQRTYACDVAAYRSIYSYFYGESPSEDALFKEADRLKLIRNSIYGPVIQKPYYWLNLAYNFDHLGREITVHELRGLKPEELYHHLMLSTADIQFVLPAVSSNRVPGALHRIILQRITPEDIYFHDRNSTDPHKLEKIPKHEFLKIWAASSFSAIIIEAHT